MTATEINLPRHRHVWPRERVRGFRARGGVVRTRPCYYKVGFVWPFTSKNLIRRHVWASQCTVQVPFGVSGFEERSITPTITGIYSCFSYLCCNTRRSTSSTTLARVHTYNTGNEKKKQGHRDNESPSTFSNYKDKTKQTKTRTVGKVPQYKILKFFSNIEGTWDMSE